MEIKANKFNSDILKKAITKKMIKIIIAKTSHAHFDHELLSAEKVPKAHTIQIAKTISWIKLIENPIMENAAQEKNPFFICCGNITFIESLHDNKKYYILLYSFI